MSDFIDKGYTTKLDVIQAIWGYKSLTYTPRPNVLNIRESNYDGLIAIENQFQVRDSYMGTPIIQPMKIQISQKGEPLEFYDLPNEPIVEIHGTKKIVETDIDGQNGTFKQLYSTGDYEVLIRGVAVNESPLEAENYPEEIIRRMRTFYELRHHLSVVGPLFTIFNIKYLTIYSFDLIPIEGAIGMQPYEFRCKSDTEFPLILKKL